MIEHLPREIAESYGISPDFDSHLLSGGSINRTVLVESEDGQRSIVQKLSPMFGPAMMQDYEVVSEHLRAEGWEIPRLLRTNTGNLFETDQDDALWRSFEFIDSDGEPEPGEVPLAEYGAILGRLHQSLEPLDYQPVFGIPHYHDTEHYADTLEDRSDLLPDDARELGQLVLARYRQLPMLTDENRQLIHSDPKINNMLHRDGAPFTFVDWDGLMHGSTWIDVGDMIRSVSKSQFLQTGSIPQDGILDLIDGYREVINPDADETAFQHKALIAGQLIGTALTMRYIADFKDGEEGYFEWDRETYSTRHAHNMDRARLQFDAVKELEVLAGSL